MNYSNERSITIKRAGEKEPSKIIFTDNFSQKVDSIVSELKGSVFIITDDHLLSIYGDKFLKGKNVISFPHGEENKTLSTVEKIEKELISKGANRDSFIIGYGGGIVTDVAGFVASTFMRGIKFGFIPTTLLAMVDASIGGKNGVNLEGYKNMVGNFKQPEWILISTEHLTTLPKRDLNAGMAEILKYALIYDIDMFNKLKCGDYNMSELIYRSAQIKADVVEQDEKESGIRRILNFGHTMAHAIEKCSNGKYLHGEAVAMGIRYISIISCKMGLINEKDLEDIEGIITSCSLPLSPEDMDMEKIQEAMSHDKKSIGKEGYINEILLNGIGDYMMVTLDLNAGTYSK